MKYHMNMRDRAVVVFGCLTAAVLLFWGAWGVRWLMEPGIPAFMYHSIATEPRDGDSELYVKPDALEEQIKFLKNKGYHGIFADEISQISAFDKSVVISFDDGYEDNYLIAFPILKKYGMKATIFVVASYVGKKANYLKPEQIKEMVDSGLVSIQSHTSNHVNLTKLSENEMDQELLNSKTVLEAITGRSVTALSYPGGYYDAKVIAHTKKYFKVAYAVNDLGIPEEPNYHITRGGVYRATDLYSLEGSLKMRTRPRWSVWYHKAKIKLLNEMDDWIEDMNLST